MTVWQAGYSGKRLFMVPIRGKMAWGLPRNRAYGLVTLSRMNFCGAAVMG